MRPSSFASLNKTQDFHPNIDNDSMVRLKRRTREEREAQDEAKQKKMVRARFNAAFFDRSINPFLDG